MVNRGHRKSVDENSSVKCVEAIFPTQKFVNDVYFSEYNQQESRTYATKFIDAGKNLQQPSLEQKFSELHSSCGLFQDYHHLFI